MYRPGKGEGSVKNARWLCKGEERGRQASGGWESFMGRRDEEDPGTGVGEYVDDYSEGVTSESG